MHRGLYARAFRGTAIEVADGEPVTLVNRVQSPSTLGNRIAGPYLVLVVVGEYPDGPGHMPLRGYAQPVLNGRLPVPVESEFERRTLQAILAAQVRLHHQGIDMAIDKPMFDTLTRDGPCRPDFRIEARSRVTGEIRASRPSCCATMCRAIACTTSAGRSCSTAITRRKGVVMRAIAAAW